MSPPAEKFILIATLVLLAIVLLFPFHRAIYIRDGGAVQHANLGPSFVFSRPSREKAYFAIFERYLSNSDSTIGSRLGTELDYGRTFLIAGAILAFAGASILVARAAKNGGDLLKSRQAQAKHILSASEVAEVQQRHNDREEPVESKTDDGESNSSRNEPVDKARTGLQVMNGLLVLFCGYVFFTGRFVWSPYDLFVWILVNFGFIAAYMLGFLVAGNPKHSKRKLAKWSNMAAVGLALLVLFASATIGRTGGLIGGIVVAVVLGVPAVINVSAFWKRSLIASPAHASTGDLIREPLDRTQRPSITLQSPSAPDLVRKPLHGKQRILTVCAVLAGLVLLELFVYFTLFTHKSVIPQAEAPRTVSITQSVSIQLPNGATTVLPIGTKVEFVSRDESGVHIRYASSEYVIPISETDLTPADTPMSAEKILEYRKAFNNPKEP
jgi:hypothetical protein